MLTLILILVINLLIILIILKYFKILRSVVAGIWHKLKVWISAKLIRVLSTLHRWTESLRKNLSISNDEKNLNLTPVKNADESGLYLKLIREKIIDPETTNIALTGRYGSGKSSLLRTFELQHPEFQYLNISLAAFNIEKPSSPETLAAPDFEAAPGMPIKMENIPDGSKGRKSKMDKESLQVEAIEYSILQQIFYHVKHQRIPYSRFKRIKNQSSYVLFFRSLLFVIWSITVAYLILHTQIFAASTNWSEYITWPLELKIVPLILSSSGAVYLLYMIFRTYNNSKFHKLNLTSGEVEISPDSELSILNRHMDELIYFFETTSFNVVVLEDLDRFNDPEIFIHLRELNSIINNSEQVHRKITFIYALRDDVFKTEKRTKFFDYIIPVIPVVDTKNSADRIRTRLADMQIQPGVIPENFITDIAQYVSDMRLIINTLNEFDLYRIRLQSSKEGNLPLLAMMFYKNMFPKQFANLQKGKGIAFELLNSRQRFLKIISTDLEKEELSILAKIEDIKNIHLNNITELRAVYILQIMKKVVAPYRHLLLDGNPIDFTEMDLDVNFELISTEASFKFQRPNGSVGSIKLSFSDIEKEVDQEQTYASRLKDLQRKNENSESKYQRRLKEIQDSVDKIRRLSLQEVLEVKSLESLDATLAKNNLLTFLVSGGYITEHYQYYLSYFYPGSLSALDMQFFFAVKEGRSLNFDHQLEKIETLINRMVIRDFSSANILNNSLVNFLLCDTSYKVELSTLMSMLANDSMESIAFINQYLRIGPAYGLFVRELGKHWHRFFSWIEFESGLSPETRLEYLEWIVTYCEPQDLQKIDFNGSLSNALNTMPDFVTWIKALAEPEHIYKIINALQLSFNRLAPLEDGDLVGEYLYGHNFYAINPHMIWVMSAYKKPEVSIENLQSANLSTLIALDLEDILGYIEEHMPTYIREVFLLLPNNSQENEGAIMFMLEQPTVTDELREQVLSKSKTKVSNISNVDHTYWPLLLRNSKMLPTWSNVYQVYEKSASFEPPLIDFLNVLDNYQILASGELDRKIIDDEVELDKFAIALMLHPGLSLPSLSYLLAGYEVFFAEADFTGIDKEKVQIILESDRLYFRITMFEQLQANFPGLQKLYVESNWDKFIESIDVLTLAAYDYELLLSSKKLEATALAELAIRVTPELIMDSKPLAHQFAKLVSQKGILTEITYDKMEALFKQIPDLKSKVDLLTSYFKLFNESEIGKLLILMGGKWKEISNYKNPRFDYEPADHNLLNMLKTASILVTTADKKGDKIPVYTKKRPD